MGTAPPAKLAKSQIFCPFLLIVGGAGGSSAHIQTCSYVYLYIHTVFYK